MQNQKLEPAMVALYQQHSERELLEMAEWIIDVAASEPNPTDWNSTAIDKAHKHLLKALSK